MDKKHGSVFGAVLLIIGGCIGVGLLGLPIMTGLCGFFPALIAFVFGFAFMLSTSLLMLEVNGWFSHNANLVSMATKTLGKAGRVASWFFFLFFFYTLLIAYIAGIGSLITSLAHDYFSVAIPDWVGSLLLVTLLGWLVYFGTRTVDFTNRYLMVGKIGTFIFLICLGAAHVNAQQLLRTNFAFVLYSLPMFVLAFGFQNLIPVLLSYMKGDYKRVRKSIILGASINLIIYLIWQVITLGIIPLEGPSGILESLKNGHEASQAISGILGSHWISYLASGLAFFAILTAFLAHSLGLSHFLGDGFKISYKRHENLGVCSLVFIPPLFVAMLYPSIFLKAMNFAGGICLMFLYGILPVLMIWKGRYVLKLEGPYRVRGGKPFLAWVLLFALFILFFQVATMLDAPFIPKIK